MINHLITINIILFITSLIFIYKRTLTYLHIFQQQEYDNTRFTTWIMEKYAVDKRATISLSIFLGIYHTIIANIVSNVAADLPIKLLCGSFILLTIAIIERNPLKFAKKKLVFTNRAKRIYFTNIIINVVINIFLVNDIYNNNNILNLFILIHAIPLYLVISNLLLKPVEYYIQRNILAAAKQKLNLLNPIIIGITGSFGKTSVKHFLGHILAQTDNTLITSGSINTSMGIARTIKQQLTKTHKYFVVEMGAYGPGSISKLCELTPPVFGIITAIGMAHYERFKNLETVAAAKFELATAVINNIYHNNKLANPASTNCTFTAELQNLSNHNNPNIPNLNQLKPIIITKQVINTNYAKIYTNNHGHYFSILDPEIISNINQTIDGLTWDLSIDGIIYEINAPIFGVHHAHNISLAVLAARQLQISMAKIITAIKTMPQINHRLEVKTEHHITIIDDSYNSNPEGFRSALELLSLFAEKGGRRILVTPGLVELGSKHIEEHLQLGIFAAKHVDILILVNLKRIKSFYTGFQQAGNNSQQILAVKSFEEAQAWLTQHTLPRDVVLLANDLPDLYESELKI